MTRGLNSSLRGVCRFTTMTTTPPNADDGRTERRTFHTNLRLEPSGDAWKASEPEADSNVYGRGETPLEAVENYAIILQDGDEQ